ncbi:stage V sporulation protein T [Gracilibacillus marinus]|uniref:Stage V sporulation protein T n=1 Tax=Gracilibacillus marinus TaxID=630535 RepID=A0ABV8W1H5_9BACI
MKATGIVRRIDDLGRVVIPKEIRRTLRIREGDPLEIFVDRDGEVILKKYSPISELGDFATEYAEALYESLSVSILISDRDEFIAVAGESKKEYLGKTISKKLDQVMETRQHALEEGVSSMEIVEGKEEEIQALLIYPIVASGDPIGCIVVISRDKRDFGEVEEKSISTAAHFLAKQME